MARPRDWARCLVFPSVGYWAERDIMAEVQAMARRGYILVHPIPDTVTEFSGVAEFPAGWIAYGFRVAPGGRLHVRLSHPKEGWFRLAMMNKWGVLEPGMLQNLIPTGNPEVSYTNPTQEWKAVYVLVDDPGWMSSAASPFRIKVDRDWGSEVQGQPEIPLATGIWARNEEDAS